MPVRDQQRPWKGLWIWGSSGTALHHRNEYIYARRTFDLPAKPVAAQVRISADNRYQLYVNGQYVCRGPARCEPGHQSYDEIDLVPYLKQGRNCIAALAHHYGESTFQSIHRGGLGFLLDGEIRCQRGKPVEIHTSKQWKAITAKAYNRRSARYTEQLGFQEVFDAEKAIPEWTRITYDDSRWRALHAYGPALTPPFENLEPRGIPFEREQPERFVGITGTFIGQNLKDYETVYDIAELLAAEKHRPTSETIVRNVAAGLKRGRGAMTVRTTPPGRFHAIVLDAGKETCGFLKLDLEARGGEIIDFFFCEHVWQDGSAVIRSADGALAPIANRYRCRAGRQQHRFFAWQGFRYVLAVFRNVRKPLKVHQISYDFTSYPVERRGSFECSDPLLNQIWEVGAWTQQLCMHDSYMDCPWREQAQWWGDARIQWRVNMAVFGDHALFKRGIRQGAQSQGSHGLTRGVFPCEEHMLVLPDYTLVWICSICDYYLYTGDDSPIRDYFDTIVRALAWFENLAGRKKVLHNPGPGYWLFLDWAPLYKGDCTTTFTLQYIEALQAAIRMAKHLGRTSEANKYGKLAQQVERAAIRMFWDTKKKQFWEGYLREKGKVYRQVAQHGNAYAILTGVQPRYHQNMADRIVWIQKNFERLAPDNAGGNQQHAKAKYPIASTFFYAYILQALFNADRGADALAGIRTLWGNMLDNGATTWHESWTHGPETWGNSSACHAWSASPTYHLSEQIGGVAPLAPGFDRVRIAPQMFDLDHAKVRTPTRHGDIEVEWQRQGKTAMDLKVKLPKRIRGVLALPGKRNRKLTGGTHRITT